MTKEEAVKMLRTMQRTVYLGNRKFEDAIECAIKALSEPLQPWEVLAAQSVLSQPEPHWIPVTERLPENEKRVLILNDDNLYMIGFIREYDCWNEWRYQYEMYDDDVYEEKEQGKIVAWMPLPEPYKGVTT